MSLARHVETVDLLRGRPFRDGGHHLTELAAADASEEQTEAERSALAGHLAARWGPPQHVGLGTVRLRAARGEPVPAPWDLVSAAAPDVELWRTDGRWIALGVVRATEDEHRILLCVTVVDPP
ncbi:hypothetical protein ACGF1Z_15290 [Streptomyces sp. NPDC048018]|uniref:hypothetical protein n=1 Tax=Streptomyces sp. NPDC048018 TaxID=3365499 RepID=UPI003712C663